MIYLYRPAHYPDLAHSSPATLDSSVPILSRDLHMRQIKDGHIFFDTLLVER